MKILLCATKLKYSSIVVAKMIEKSNRKQFFFHEHRIEHPLQRPRAVTIT